jgi:hypothetical protein
MSTTHKCCMFGAIAIDEAHINFTATQDRINEILHRKSHVHRQISPCPQFMFVPLCMQDWTEMSFVPVHTEA